jgi:DNA helicase-2/ATP-dependent DNA helicase PcrA
MAQTQAAQAAEPQVRLVAGPGTGKSRTVEERVHWLLESQQTPPDSIYVVSFTRAASTDLRLRIQKFCRERGIEDAGLRVSVSTLHSLALRVLRNAGQLGAYAVGPQILDNWELENIFDREFSNSSGATPGRCEKIRRDHEAFWSTGAWGPPNYIPPDPPISANERARFNAFHGIRTQVYSCVLPGELVKKCVDSARAGLINPTTLLNAAQLVVDEYQDLNPYDIDFVSLLTAGGVTTFVAGDDDQSIYSFRFASPAGIQSFTTRYPQAVAHTLTNCLRCSVSVVEAANTLISANAIPNRIPKTLISMHGQAQPPEAGVVHRWRFNRDLEESRAIAESCRSLIDNGLPPREILILISNTRIQASLLGQQLQTAGVDFESPREESFLNTESGRLALSVLRVICDRDDYVAHRTTLGLLQGVGSKTCGQIAEAVVANNLRFIEIFYAPLPAGVFNTRATGALIRARTVCALIRQWDAAETLAQRGTNIRQLLTSLLGNDGAQAWAAGTGNLPPDMTLEEVKNYLWADNDEQQARLLERVYDRLALSPPSSGFLAPKVRMMTMHGAKGLDATVVFIPGLEEDILPGSKRLPYAGLVLEAARLLYVSVTRARAACVLSYADARVVFGRIRRQVASQFLISTGGPFQARDGGLATGELGRILDASNNLR